MAAFCSTSSMPTRSRSLMARRMPNSSRTSSGASPKEGSSSSISLGASISARDTASICCSPPDSVPARVCAQAQVLLGGEVEEGAATVGNVRDAQARDVLGAAAVDALTAKTDLALGLHHAAQGAQGRRLARAVRPEQGRDRLFLHCEDDPVDHPRGAVGGVEAGYLEQHQ